MVETLEKIPENSIIHTHNYISEWNGYLAIVFSDMRFDPKNLTSEYIIEYITGEDNEPIKVEGTNKWMIGKFIGETTGGAKYVEDDVGKYIRFWTPATERVLLKKTVKELKSDESAKYTNYLSELGYVDNTDWQISKTAWQDLFRNGFDELEKKDSGSANKVYELLRFKFGRDFDVGRTIDSSVNTIKGVFTLSKADLKHRIYTLKWAIENKRAKNQGKTMTKKDNQAVMKECQGNSIVVDMKFKENETRRPKIGHVVFIQDVIGSKDKYFIYKVASTSPKSNRICLDFVKTAKPDTVIRKALELASKTEHKKRQETGRGSITVFPSSRTWGITSKGVWVNVDQKSKNNEARLVEKPSLAVEKWPGKDLLVEIRLAEPGKNHPKVNDVVVIQEKHSEMQEFAIYKIASQTDHPLMKFVKRVPGYKKAIAEALNVGKLESTSFNIWYVAWDDTWHDISTKSS